MHRINCLPLLAMCMSVLVLILTLDDDDVAIASLLYDAPISLSFCLYVCLSICFCPDFYIYYVEMNPISSRVCVFLASVSRSDRVKTFIHTNIHTPEISTYNIRSLLHFCGLSLPTKMVAFICYAYWCANNI